jgi:hypothetical protein
MIADIVERARHWWLKILPALGIGAEIKPAIELNVRLGLIAVTGDGFDLSTGKRKPTTYRLTYDRSRDEAGIYHFPTNEWK